MGTPRGYTSLVTMFVSSLPTIINPNRYRSIDPSRSLRSQNRDLNSIAEVDHAFQYFRYDQVCRLLDQFTWECLKSNKSRNTRFPQDWNVRPSDPNSELIAYEHEQLDKLNRVLDQMRPSQEWLDHEPRRTS